MNLTKEEFEETIVEECNDDTKLEYGQGTTGSAKKTGWDSFRPSEYGNWKQMEPDELKIICVSWCIGGSSGGSCWGGTSEGYVERNPDVKELILFDNVMERLFPNLTFWQYRKMRTKLVKSDTRSDGGDYYGNYHTYQYLFVLVDEWYDYLKETGLIE